MASQNRNRATPARMCKVNKNLTPGHKGYLAKHHLGGLSKVKAKAMPLGLSQWLIECYDPETSRLVIPGRGVIAVDAKSVRRVFALPNGGRDVDYDWPTDVVQVIEDNYDIETFNVPKITDFCDKLEAMRTADKKWMRAYLIVAFSTLLCPTTSLKISPRSYKLALDVLNIAEYNVCSFVAEQINAAIRSKKGKTKSVCCCGYLLMILYLDSLHANEQIDQENLCRADVWSNELIAAVAKKDRKPSGEFGKLRFKDSVGSVPRDSLFLGTQGVEDFVSAKVPPNYNIMKKRKITDMLSGITKDISNRLGVLVEELVALDAQAEGVGEASRKRKRADKGKTKVQEGEEKFDAEEEEEEEEEEEDEEEEKEEEGEREDESSDDDKGGTDDPPNDGSGVSAGTGSADTNGSKHSGGKSSSGTSTDSWENCTIQAWIKSVLPKKRKIPSISAPALDLVKLVSMETRVDSTLSIPRFEVPEIDLEPLEPPIEFAWKSAEGLGLPSAPKLRELQDIAEEICPSSKRQKSIDKIVSTSSKNDSNLVIKRGTVGYVRKKKLAIGEGSIASERLVGTSEQLFVARNDQLNQKNAPPIGSTKSGGSNVVLGADHQGISNSGSKKIPSQQQTSGLGLADRYRQLLAHQKTGSIRKVPASNPMVPANLSLRSANSVPESANSGSRTDNSIPGRPNSGSGPPTDEFGAPSFNIGMEDLDNAQKKGKQVGWSRSKPPLPPKRQGPVTPRNLQKTGFDQDDWENSGSWENSEFLREVDEKAAQLFKEQEHQGKDEALGFMTPAKQGIPLVGTQDGPSGFDNSSTPVVPLHERRLIKKPAFLRSPYIDENDKWPFFCSKEVHEIYRLITTAGIARRTSIKVPDESSEIINIGGFWCTLRELGTSMRVKCRLSSTVVEIGILDLMIQFKDRKVKKHIMPLRMRRYLLDVEWEVPDGHKQFSKKEFNLHKMDMVLFPVLETLDPNDIANSGHYWLFVMNLRDKKFQVLDSMRTLADPTLKKSASKLSGGTYFFWETNYPKHISMLDGFKLEDINPTKQTTTFDCGVRMLLNCDEWEGRTLPVIDPAKVVNVRKLMTHRWITSRHNKANWRKVLGMNK